MAKGVVKTAFKEVEALRT
jgi:hypothetical protein